MNVEQGIALAGAVVQAEFVDRGMCADLNLHWDIAADGLAKPHAHVMLTLREVNEDGFGAKVRDWNKSELVCEWREHWETHVNERLAELDIDARIDHRSLQAQGIDLEPQSKIGAPAQRMGPDADRLIEHHAIARENGERIIANPDIALDAITKQRATFTRRDLAIFIHRHSDGKEQFDLALSAVQNSDHVVALGLDGRGNERFTSRDMLDVETRLHQASQALAGRELHQVSDRDRESALASAEARGLILSGEQSDAFDRLTQGKDVSVVVGYAGTGKSAMLGVAREAWEQSGYSVRGVALSGIAAENLEAGSGIQSRTIASMEHGWEQGRDLLTSRDVLVIDEVPYWREHVPGFDGMGLRGNDSRPIVAEGAFVPESARLGADGVIPNPDGLRGGPFTWSAPAADDDVSNADAVRPSGDRAVVATRLGETSAAASMMVVKGSPSFSGVKDVRAALQRADVSVSVPASDATSVAMLESMACALPVVATDLPANRAWIDAGQRVPVDDVPALAAALCRLADDAPLRRSIGQRNRQAVEERASRTMHMDRMAALYDALRAPVGEAA